MSHVPAHGRAPAPRRAGPAPACRRPARGRTRTVWLQPRGVLGLGLYFSVVAALADAAAAPRELVVDLAQVQRITDSGCAAFIAIERLALRERFLARVANADAALIARMRPLCRAIRWHRAARARRARPDARAASTP